MCDPISSKYISALEHHLTKSNRIISAKQKGHIAWTNEHSYDADGQILYYVNVHNTQLATWWHHHSREPSHGRDSQCRWSEQLIKPRYGIRNGEKGKMVGTEEGVCMQYGCNS